jgi:hypothetical protein
MAITTRDALLAGMQPAKFFMKVGTPTLVIGRMHSLFYLNGIPGAAVAPTPGVAGAALTTYGGQIPFTNPVSGNTHLSRLYMQSSAAGSSIVADRLWHNSGLSMTLTTAQTVNSVAWPARSADGTVNGLGVMIGVEVTTATGAGTPTFSMSYTNQDGVSGRTGTGIQTGVASSAVGAFYPMGLQAGDTGVRSIQTFTLSATWTSGAMSLVAYRVLDMIPQVLSTAPPAAVDAITGSFARLYNDSVPFGLLLPLSTVSQNITGIIVFAQG